MRALLLLCLAGAACGRVGFSPVDGEAASSDGAARDGVTDGPDMLVDGTSASCPATAPTCGVAGSCAETLSCPYADGTCCTCDGNLWVCLPPNPGPCPATAPVVGQACNMPSLSCGYCQTFVYTCDGVMWTNGGSPC